MTEFWWGALALLCLAGLFLLVPGLFLRQRRIEDREASNREWFANRRVELGDTDTGVDPSLQDDLLQDAKLRCCWRCWL